MTLKLVPPDQHDPVFDESFIRAGGPIDRNTVGLRFFGDDLDPLEITTLLGHEPTSFQIQGQPIPNRSPEVIAKIGSWSLRTSLAEDQQLEIHILELLALLSSDLSIWRDLTTRFKADLFSGLFLENFNRGLSLSPSCLEAISKRNLELNLDIYCNADFD